VSLTSVANLPTVSLIPVAICHQTLVGASGVNDTSSMGAKFTSGVVDTSGEFVPTVVDTSGKFVTSVVDTVGAS
jgi:hypothetical protein